jgi:superfamily II DNA or RNA helicase
MNNSDLFNNENNYIGYPKVDDPEFQSKVYKKREFYYYKLPPRPDLNNYQEIEDYRNKICKPSGQLLEHQSLLSNFINPDTPYKGLLIFHGTGTGKCLHKDTMVNNYSISIEQMWNRYSSNNIIRDNENGEWTIPLSELIVKSIGHNNNIVNGKVKYLYREQVKTTLYIITLKNGYTVTKTFSHKLFDGSVWTNSIIIGCRIAYYDYIRNKISYDEVVDVNEIYYDDFVYDLSIEKYHNFIANYICCHNTCAAIAIAEKFKQQVARYGTHVYILVPGPLLKENWKEHFIKCTGDTYMRENENLVYLNDEEKEKLKRQAIQNAMQYYKIMSYRSFYRKVLGEKIIEKREITGDKMKTSYKKNEEGDYERDIGIEKIHNINNSLIIVEEAHNLTGNAYGEALLKILKNSINLKVILLTATPMKNLADDIVELLNFIRPVDSPIDRDMIFNSNRNYLMDLKPNGLQYLKNMAQGYVSHLRGADPMTFAEKIEMGVKPKGLLFTKISRCVMEKFQLEAYEQAKKLAQEEADSLDKKSESVANFVFPALDESRKKLIGLYGREGLNQLKNQLKNHYQKINNMIATDILKLKKADEEYLTYNENTKNISGAILKKEYLKYFSIKFHQALTDIEDNLFVNDKNSVSSVGFVYSNLVKIGIEIFKEILLQNGYLEYDENKNNYQIKDTTICYHCGKKHDEHKKNNDKSNHEFAPATFIVVTGQTSEESAEVLPENNKKIISTVFNNFSNKEGKFIKLVLGSKVMNEGISLANVNSTYILDVYFNFGRIDQVIGRAIRWCSHFQLMNKDNVYPKVKLYKYAVCTSEDATELSTEEELYFKAEKKYMLVKKVERALKEVAIDCALNQPGNMFKEEIKLYNKCITPNDKLLNMTINDKNMNKLNICPSKCDFTDCLYKCNDAILNSKYYDPNRNLYKNINKNELDYSTFTSFLAKNEIDNCKEKIKELYMTNYVYNLKTITTYVIDSLSDYKKDLFDDFFVQKALDELIPITENDFNNFKDVLYDKNYRAGYLIYLDGYYIFQPFDENENVPMYYRTNYQKNYQSKLSLHNYLVNENLDISSDIGDDNLNSNNLNEYIFDDVIDYYENRKEFEFVGIIDKEVNRKKNKRFDEIKDVFKIREKRDKILEKKRGTGIPSLKGAVCATSKQKEYLEKLAKSIGVKNPKSDITREDLCNNIMDKLIELEKYSTGKNKMTYIMIPKNHPTLKFPLNLEDRIDYIKDQVNKILSFKIKFSEKVKDKTINLSFKLDKKPSKDEILKLKNLNLLSDDHLKWNIIIE